VVTIGPEPLDSDDARALITELDDFLTALYPPEDNFLELPTADVFLVARIGGDAVGCGAVRFIEPGVAEVKRMYVRPAARGNGIARQMLGALEAFAVESGARRLVLETGELQLEALALYEGFGFELIPCFGEYASSKTSRCYEKPLRFSHP
jgi:putative acetyltransferase